MLKISWRSIKIWPSYEGLKFRNPSRFDRDMKISSEKVWYGEGVWYGNGGIEGESILIRWFLWAHAENFMEIHQDLAKLRRFEVQRA